MGMIFFSSTGPRGEDLAEEAGRVTDIPVGIDPEGGITFDADPYEEAELQGIVFDALGNIDSDWREHLTPED